MRLSRDLLLSLLLLLQSHCLKWFEIKKQDTAVTTKKVMTSDVATRKSDAAKKETVETTKKVMQPEKTGDLTFEKVDATKTNRLV